MSTGIKFSWSGKIFKINVNNTWCSQAVTHPSTNHAQSCLTAVIIRDPVFTTWYGRWQQSTTNPLKYVLYFIMQHIALFVVSNYFSKYKLVIFYIFIYLNPTFTNILNQAQSHCLRWWLTITYLFWLFFWRGL